MAKRNIQVCMTPKLFSLYADKKSIVVVIDVLRATSSMCIAFHSLREYPHPGSFYGPLYFDITRMNIERLAHAQTQNTRPKEALGKSLSLN